MDAYAALGKAASHAGMSLAGIGRAMGKPDSYVSGGKSRGSVPKCDTMAAMLEACGHVLAVIPADEVPPGAIVIDPPRP